MANRDVKRVSALERSLVVIAGSFRPNGSSAVDNTLNTGHGWTVARTSAGVFTVTLEDTWQSLIAGHIDLALSAPDDKFLQWGAIDVASAKTLVINVWDVSGAAVADVASNAANRIHFTLLLKNSTVY